MPLSGTMKPNPFPASNHLIAPEISMVSSPVSPAGLAVPEWSAACPSDDTDAASSLSPINLAPMLPKALHTRLARARYSTYWRPLCPIQTQLLRVCLELARLPERHALARPAGNRFQQGELP